jgi:hypothetical protein
MNSQNMMVFNVELGFTALPHLPDLPARGTLQSPAHQASTVGTSTGMTQRFSIAYIYLDACGGPK